MSTTKNKQLFARRLWKSISKSPDSNWSLNTWNRVFNACESFEECSEWYGLLLEHGPKPNIYTFNKMLRRTECREEAEWVLTELFDSDVLPDIWTVNTWLFMYSDFVESLELVRNETTTDRAETITATIVTYHVIVDKAETIDQLFQVTQLMQQRGFDWHQDERVWRQIRRLATREQYHQIIEHNPVSASVQTRTILQQA